MRDNDYGGSDGAMAKPAQQLIAGLLGDHTSALRLLRLLAARMKAVAELRDEDLALSRDIMSYMTKFIDCYHHPREDLVSQAVHARRPELEAQLGRFDAAHEHLQAAGAALMAALGHPVRSPAVKTIPRLFAVYVEEIAAHFEAEEQALFALALETLSFEDCRRIHTEIQQIADPVFGPQVNAEFEALFHRYVSVVDVIGGEGRGIAPTAAAVVIDVTGAILAGIAEAVSSVREGARNSLAASMNGAGQVIRARSFKTVAIAAHDWADSARGEAAITFRRLGQAATCARISTVDSIGGALAGPPRKFRAVSRIDRSAPSWQAQFTNVALRATVKRMMATGDVGSIRDSAPSFERWTPRLARDVSVQQIDLGETHAELFEIDGCDGERTILHLPGGGFLFPATQIHRLLVARIARATSSRVMLVHYRLAPDHPFPAGLNDVLAAYRHLLREGVDPQRISICGDSAGGGLALSLLQALRENGEPLPNSVVLLSPLADLSNSGESRQENRWHDPMLPLDRKNNLAELYLRDVAVDDPMVSPVFADFHGFPPMLIQVGSTEILLDDALRIAARARSHGVECDAEVWHQMPHDWMLIGSLPEARKALDRFGDFLDRHMPIREAADRSQRQAA